MAQIIKHRRGSIDSLKNSTSRKGELIMATGSIGNLNGPFVFIGTDEGSGLYSPASKLYAGTEVPTIVATTYGTTLDGTPFYATGEKSLYILNNSNVGNSKIDLSGNLEGNTISGVTINTLNSTNITASFFTGAFVGDASGLTNVPVSGLTGFDSSKIVSGSVSGSILSDGKFRVNGDSYIDNNLSISGDTNVTGTLYVNDDIVLTGSLYVTDIIGTGSLYLQPDQGDSRYFEIYNTGMGDTHIKASGGYSFFGDDTNYLKIDDSLQTVSLTGVNGVFVSSFLNVNGNTSITGALVVSNGSATFDQGLVAQNSNMLLTSGSSLLVQNNGYVATDYIQGNTNEYNYLSLNGNGINGQPGVELSSTGDISLWAEGGNVNVTGSMKVTGDVTVEQALYVSGNIYQTGSFYTQGDIVLSGSINIGNSLTGDTINFGGEVNSHILPTTGATYNLGSSGQTWNNVYAEYYYGDGSHLTNISLTGITGLNKITDGPVSASILENGGFQVNTNSAFTGSFNVSGGTTTISGDFVANGSNSTLTANYGGNNIELNAYNGATIDLNGPTNINGNTSLTGSLNGHDVSGSWAIVGNTFGQTTLQSPDGALLLQGGYGGVQINGANADLTVNGYTNVGGALNVTGATTLYSATTINAGLTVTGTTDLKGGLNITGATNASGAMKVTGSLNLKGDVIVTDNVTASYFTGSFVGDGSNLTNISMTGVTGLNFSKIYDGNATASISEGNGFQVNTSGSFTGSVTITDNLYVSGTTSLGGDVSLVSGNTFYTNHIADYSNDALDITSYGELKLESTNALSVVLQSDNAEAGTNYLHVNDGGVDFTTFDITSGLTHKVLLDNTGSLHLENVNVGITGSLDVSGSFNSYGVTHIHNDLYVSGNLAILGSGSIVHISASQVDIGTNIINLNTYAPFERFAGIAVYDSGSNAGITGSLLWDSTNDVWIYSNPSGSNYASARLISGPMNTGSLGNETGLTNGHFPIATGDDHISDSLLTYLGTELALNTNKFTVDSGTGDMMIDGNFTIKGVGATDNGSYSSYIVFKNDADELGFVGTNDTTNVTDRLLGYNSSTGVLEFSSLIDGGTY
jgi:cytoskeletal protein CcmA (bactofilin family)